MTRILHVLDHSLPLHSGYTFRTRALLKAQRADGFDARGITGARHAAAGPPVETVDGLTFHRIPPPRTGPPGLREAREITALADGIVALAQDWRPDILHAHSPPLGGMAGVLAARRLGVPLVYEIRAFWEDAAVGNGTGREGSPRYRLTRALENAVVRRADRVVTICEGLRADLLGRGHRAETMVTVPNGVDMALFGAPAPRDPALAERLGLGPGLAAGGAPVIGFVGSFYDYEGLDDLIAALPRLRRRHPGAAALLVGGGPVEPALRAAAGDGVVFTGRVPHDAVERYYPLIDILVYPRKASRLTELVTPLKPLEAMAQGRLVAASAVGGHRELIEDGVTGALFAPGDPAALADTLADLLDRRDTWPAVTAAARAHVARHHDWARNVAAYRALYKGLLEAGAAPPAPGASAAADEGQTPS